jgi:hypothetical protein
MLNSAKKQLLFSLSREYFLLSASILGYAQVFSGYPQVFLAIRQYFSPSASIFCRQKKLRDTA